MALDSEVMPLYNLLREPKRLEVFEGGHVPPPARLISSDHGVVRRDARAGRPIAPAASS
jgi:hypothetical protein